MRNPETEYFRNYTRRCLVIFGALLCGTLLMVGISAAPLPTRSLNIALVLAVAGLNGSLVAGFLMHLISERRVIYTVLAFTGIFAIALMALSVYARYDVPSVIPR
jgi:FtsH-binding integral membrane protein